MQRTKWTDRKFTFDFPEGWIYNILERLRGTPIRLTWMTTSLKEEMLILKPDGKWSIKEHIGHLTDLEELHEGRIEDFINRKEMLRAWETTNAKTENANHNAKSLESLIDDFTQKRNQFINRLLSLDEATQNLKSIHPRLQIPMRPVDVAYFTAEHDDHHLASIHEIIMQ